VREDVEPRQDTAEDARNAAVRGTSERPKKAMCVDEQPALIVNDSTTLRLSRWSEMHEE